MSAEDASTSFVTRAFRRLARLCRRSSHGENAASVMSGPDEPQQSGGSAPPWETLPALPTHSQLLQGGGRLAYRQRGPEECEPAALPGSWALAEQPVQGAEWCTHARLTSLSSRNPMNMTFYNGTRSDAVVLWLGYDGNEVAYLRLEPGQYQWLQTFSNHPWIFRSVATRKCLNWQAQQVVYAGDGHPLGHPVGSQVPHPQNAFLPGSLILIREPPRVRWCQASHRAFPASFRAASVAFLLCHHFSSAQLNSQAARSPSVLSSGRHCASLIERQKSLLLPLKRFPLCPLGDLPLVLVVAIIGMAAPEVWQQSTCTHREGRLDLAPVRVPATLTPSEQGLLLGTVQAGAQDAS